MTENPYQPPKVTVSDPVDMSESGLVEPKKLSAGRGWGWIQDAFKYFMSSPAIWIVNVIILLVIMMVLAFIPLIGSLAANILAPIFTGGLMLGCAAQDRGEQLTVGHLFEGFQKNTGNLAMVGVLYMVAMIVVVVIITLLMMVMGGGSGLFPMMAGIDSDAGPSPDQVQSLFAVGGIAILIGLALIVPVVMAYFFAPALVVHHDLGAIEAMKLSFKGCLKNIIPFLIYGVIAVVLAIVASVPFFLGWLVLAPVLTAAIYVAYKEIFTEKIE
ncbi:MAG TPA: DUF2189 domain-containing protein [Chromatiales bacterium]|nr:DUF2189 domain-containing protein [Thiotrichales bacterium]HIP67224.1 DUF2189 domain-containing protein [Chromatiales bacterium]